MTEPTFAMLMETPITTSPFARSFDEFKNLIDNYITSGGDINAYFNNFTIFHHAIIHTSSCDNDNSDCYLDYILSLEQLDPLKPRRESINLQHQSSMILSSRRTKEKIKTKVLAAIEIIHQKNMADETNEYEKNARMHAYELFHTSMKRWKRIHTIKDPIIQVEAIRKNAKEVLEKCKLIVEEWKKNDA